MGSEECLKDRDRWKYNEDGWEDGQGWEGEGWSMERGRKMGRGEGVEEWVVEYGSIESGKMAGVGI